MSWHNLVGTPKQYAGTSGTVTLGAGEVLLYITAWASASSATVQILGGPTIPIPQSNATNPAAIWTFWVEHTLFQANQASMSIVFTNTAHYFVHTVKQGNA